MRGKSLPHEDSDATQIPMREAFRWTADLEAAGSAIWYRGGERWWTGRYNRSHDGVSREEEQADPDSLYAWYRTLLALRHDRPELRRGDQRILCDDASAVLCILRTQGTRRTLLLVNLGDTDARPALGEALPAAAHWRNLIDDHPAGALDAILLPMQGRLLGTE